MLISIEGNIGSGKSTIINFLKTLDSDNIIFVDEPVNEWLNIKVDGKNALEMFYEDQKTNSFWFQILAYITRLRNLLNTIKENPDKIIISERSIYTDKNIFAQMLYEQGNLSEIEMKTYSYWFDTFEKETKLDLVLYVNTGPEECFNRIKKRNRDEESNIPLEYLSHCHNKHLEWLNNTDSKVVKVNGHQSIKNIQTFMKEFISKNFV
jgi:deoxyadenosine/deoxycytidine kinase